MTKLSDEGKFEYGENTHLEKAIEVITNIK